MRRYLRIPQLAAVMGQCIAGGAYLPALSDVILMVKGSSFMGLGGPNLVKGATGQTIDGETLGGAITHTEVSGVAHYALDDDQSCIKKLRESRGAFAAAHASSGRNRRSEAPATDPQKLYDILPADHRMSYDMHNLLRAVLDGGEIDEFQPHLAKEMICGDAKIEGITVGVIANQRGSHQRSPGEKPRFGGIIYAESAEKVAYFIERCDKQGIPLLFVQDVSGFMVGPESEHEGVIRAGAHFVEAMACARVPKIVLTVNHASGAGYYAMAGQGFDPDFLFTWPTGRMAVMEGEAAVSAVHGPTMAAAKAKGVPLSPEVAASVEEMRADYEEQLDARYACARGYADTILYPEDTRTIARDGVPRRTAKSRATSGRVQLAAHAWCVDVTITHTLEFEFQTEQGCLIPNALYESPAGRASGAIGWKHHVVRSKVDTSII